MIKHTPPEIPPVAAHGFVDAMRACLAEEDPTKWDAIAAHQLSILGQYEGPREKPLRLSDVKTMFRGVVG